MIKKRSYFILIVLAVLSLIIIGCLPNYSKASDAIDDPNGYRPTPVGQNDINAITEKTNSIIGIITTVGTVISVITIMILGIKYMVGTVEEKAEYKKSMVPYLIGAVLLFSITTIVRIIASIVQNSSLGV